MTRPARTRKPRRALALACLLVLLPAASPLPARGTASPPSCDACTPARSSPGERWRRRSTVRLADGREVPREQAYRDDPVFVAASRVLLGSRAKDDAPLGAWLLGTLPEGRRPEGEPVLVEALDHRDPRAAFEAAQALAAAGGAGALGALRRTAASSRSADVRTAAVWAAGEVAWRAAAAAPSVPASRSPLAPGFRRGVSWWMSEGRSDSGEASFRRLASLGVTWVSIHTWDPLQRDLDDPVLAAPDRHFGFRDLGALVRAAHAAGLRVMVKPHLEMRGYEATDEERRLLRGPDSPERRALVARVESRMASGEHLQHNRIAMRSEADWRTWFESYAAYILPYAREARAAGAEMFCVGRELDSTVVQREGDWRALVARIRSEFPRAAHLLGQLRHVGGHRPLGRPRLHRGLGLLPAVGAARSRGPPTSRRGGTGALGPLEEASRRWGRLVLLTEAGFPSIPSAARAPWREERTAADVWLQARCYEATLRSLSRRPRIEGAFFWLWERTSPPAFRDPSHAIVGKPATFTLARWYLGGPVPE